MTEQLPLSIFISHQYQKKLCSISEKTRIRDNTRKITSIPASWDKQAGKSGWGSRVRLESDKKVTESRYCFCYLKALPLSHLPILGLFFLWFWSKFPSWKEASVEAILLLRIVSVSTSRHFQDEPLLHWGFHIKVYLLKDLLLGSRIFPSFAPSFIKNKNKKSWCSLGQSLHRIKPIHTSTGQILA